MTTTTFIAPHQAIQGAIDRAYSIHVMYREAIRVPHATPGMPDIGTPGSRLIAKMAKLNIHQVFTPQMGGHKRDFRILKANRAPRLYFPYEPEDEFGSGFVIPMTRGHVRTYPEYRRYPISHVPYKAGVRRHREGC